MDERLLADAETVHRSITLESQAGQLLEAARSPSNSFFPPVPSESFRSMAWRIIIVRFLVFLTPSFLQGRHSRNQTRSAENSPTAYLDGMRGLAAISVFLCHYFYQAFVITESWGCDTTNYHLLKLPFLRLLYQGPPAVCIFFVISGYALSYRPLKLIRSNCFSDFAPAMSSLVFRRGIRLYLPPAISTFMIIGMLRIGAYEWTREFASNRKYMRVIVEPHPAKMESAYAQYKSLHIDPGHPLLSATQKSGSGFHEDQFNRPSLPTNAHYDTIVTDF